MEFIKTHDPGRALDLGCGTGTNVITLAENSWVVTGIDFSNKAIHLARKKLESRNLNAEFLVGNVTRLDNVAGKFDLILDIGCFHSLNSAEKMRYINNLPVFLNYKGNYVIYGWIKESDHGGNGIYAKDLVRFDNVLTLYRRQDGTERGAIPSAWLYYKK